jgi:hypothetical protein
MSCELTLIKETAVKKAISTFVQNAKSLTVDGNTVTATYGQTTSRGRIISKDSIFRMMETKAKKVDKWAVQEYGTQAAKGFVRLSTLPNSIKAEFKMPFMLEDMYKKQIAERIKPVEIQAASTMVSRLDFFNGDQLLFEQEQKEFDTLEGEGFQKVGQDTFLFTDNRSPKAKAATLKYIAGKLERLYGVQIQFVSGPQSFKGRWLTDSNGLYLYQISEENASIDTPLHEIIEPFIVAVSKSDPGVIDVLFNQIKSIPGYSKLVDNIKAVRPELNDLGLKVEVISQIIGEKAAKTLQENASTKGVFAAIKKFFRALRDAILRMFDTVALKKNDFLSVDENTTLEELTKLLVQGRIKLNPSPEGRVNNLAKTLGFIEEGETVKGKSFTYSQIRRMQHELNKDLSFFGSSNERVAITFKQIKGTENFIIDKIVNDPTGKLSTISNKQLDVYENALVDEIESSIDEEIANDPNFLDKLTGTDIIYDLSADPVAGLTISGEKSDLFNILMNFEELSINDFVSRLTSLQGSFSTVKLLNHMAINNYNSSCKVKYKSIPNTSRLAEYDASTNTLFINSDFVGNIEYLEEVVDGLAHEIVHAKTVRPLYLFSKGEIDQLSVEELEFAKRVNKIYQKAITIGKEEFPDFDSLVDVERSFRGFKDIYEFAAEALTNKEFISMLNKIDDASKIIPGYFKRIQNLFEDFINAILDFLNVSVRVGERESAFQIYSNFFSFQKVNPASETFAISNSDLLPLGLDISYVDTKTSDRKFAQILVGNLKVQIKQFEELIRNAETFEEIEQRAYYERELNQRRQLLNEISNMLEINEEKNAIESFIKSTKDRIQSIYDDVSTIPNNELASSSTRNKIYLLKSYLNSLGPILNSSGNVLIGKDITAAELQAYEAYQNNKAIAEATLDDFDYTLWLASNPDPSTTEIVMYELGKLAENTNFLLTQKIHPAIAQWLAEDITDEDLMELDEVYKDEVDSIIKSDYTSEKKLSLIKTLKITALANNKDQFLQELEGSLRNAVFNGGKNNRYYDIMLHPTINGSDIAMSLFAKKFKAKFSEARNKSNNVAQELINAVGKFKKATNQKVNIISPESFFKKIVTKGEHNGLVRPKLLTEYNKEQFYKDREVSFAKYEKEYKDAEKLIDDDYNNNISSGVDAITAMVMRSTALSAAKSNHNKKIKNWYDTNTVAYTQQELQTIIDNVRNDNTKSFDLFVDSIKAGVTDPVELARINDVADVFRKFRQDRAVDKINAEQQFSVWYKGEKVKPDFRSIVERIRNQFDYFENQYETWFSKNISVSGYNGDFIPKGKLIKPAAKYLNQDYITLTPAERDLLDTLYSINTKWQNKLPASERLPESFLPIVPKDVGIATPFTKLGEQGSVNKKIISFFKGLGGVFRNMTKSFFDLFKSSFSDSEYRRTISNLSDFKNTLLDNPLRNAFPVYYTNIGNPKIKFDEIESNPLVSLMKANIMANEYDARSDLFSEIQLFDHIMENRYVVSHSSVEDYIKSNTIDVGVDPESSEKFTALKKSRSIGKRILGGLIKLFWIKSRKPELDFFDTQNNETKLDMNTILNGIDNQFSIMRDGVQDLNVSNKTLQYEQGINYKFLASAENTWNYFKNSQLYGSERNQSNLLSGTLDNLLFWKSLVGLAGNFYSATNTVVVGTLNNLVNSSTGDEFGKRNLLLGFLKAANSMNSMFIANNTGLNSGRLSAMSRYLFEHLDILQGESYKRMTDRTSMELQAIKILNNPISKLGFGMQSYTEGFIALQTAYAVMESMKIPARLNTFGKEVSFSKMYDFDPNTGHITLSSNFTGTPEEFFNLEQKLINNVHKVMKENQGIYDSFNRIQLSQYSFGRALLQFRKYLIPSLDKRAQRFTLDVETMRYKKGYYRGSVDVLARKGIFKGLAAFGRNSIVGGVKSFGLNILQDPLDTNPLKLSKLEKSSVNSFMMERAIIYSLNALSTILLSYAVTAKGETPDEDDDLGDKTNDGLAFALFYVRRAKIELGSLLDPIAYLSLITTIPVTDQIMDMYKGLFEGGKILTSYLKRVMFQDMDSDEAWEKAKDVHRYSKETDKAQYRKVKKLIPITDSDGNITSYEEITVRELPTKFEVYFKDIIPGVSNYKAITTPIKKYNSLRRYTPNSPLDILKEEKQKSSGGRISNSEKESKETEPKESKE